MKRLLFLILMVSLLICSSKLHAQSNYAGLHLEGIAPNLVNSNVNMKSSISNLSGLLLFQESNTIPIDSSGKWWITVGAGTFLAGSFSTLDSIPFYSDTCFIEIEFELGGSWESILFSKLNYVPFSYHSLTTNQTYSLSSIIDTTTTGVNVIFDSIWQKGSAKADYAENSNFSTYADSAGFAYYLILELSDTAQFSYYSDSSGYSAVAGGSELTLVSGNTDTSTVALDGAWFKTGNALSSQSFLGTRNNVPIEIKTNGISRLFIDSARMYRSYPMDSSIANLSLKDMSFRFKGTSGVGVYPLFSNRLHFAWIADKAAMRTGVTNDSTFSSSNVGYASHVFGTNNICRAQGAIVIGDSNVVDPIGEYSFVIGKGHYVNQRYNLVSGKDNYAGYERNVVMGFNCSVPTGYGSVAMGYNVISGGNPGPTWSFGKDIVNGKNSNVLLGTGIDAGPLGLFVYADFSPDELLLVRGFTGFSSNSFIVRASGGVYIYSDASLTTGVCLFPGSGSWSTTSNKEVKNMVNDNPSVLKELDQMIVYDWSYKSFSTKHIGPMAQDLMLHFGYGESDKLINSIDIDGIVLRGAKELNGVYNEMELNFQAPLSVSFEDVKRRLKELEKVISYDE